MNYASVHQRRSMGGHTLQPVLLVLVPVAIVAAILIFSRMGGNGASQDVAGSAAGEPAIQSMVLQSAFYHLKVHYYSNFLPASTATGGALAPLDSGYLLVNGDGQLFSVEWTSDPEAADSPAPEMQIKALPYRAPLNGAELDVANIRGLSRHWFRVLDVLTLDSDVSVRVLVSHHVWKPAPGCFVVRVSQLEGPPGELYAGTAAAEWTTVFESSPCLPPKAFGHVFMGQESGGRLAALPTGEVLLTLGDLQFDGIHAEAIYAQDPTASYGKTLLLDIDTGTSRIYTLGHRNPQGLYVAPDGTVWATEHGPRGGDELNLLVEGSNYGWPYVTFGTQYRTRTWPLNETQAHHDGYALPAFAWVPSIGVSNLMGVEQAAFPAWQGDLLVSSLREQALFRMHIENQQVLLVEPIPVGARIRDLLEGPAGQIILWTDNQTIALISPLADANDGRLVFETECGGCHSHRDTGGRLRSVGPNLVGIYNQRQAAADSDFRYSEALQDLPGVWDEAQLDAFLQDPAGYAPGTSMQVPGISDPQRRAAIISFLQSLQ
jgi:cytochrome c2